MVVPEEWWGSGDKGRGLAQSLSDQGTRLGKAGRQTDLNRPMDRCFPKFQAIWSTAWWGNISRPDPVQVRQQSGSQHVPVGR